MWTSLGQRSVSGLAVLRHQLFGGACRRQLLSTAASSTAKVGFIGLGNMGLPMAVNLAKDHKVVAFDTNAEACAKAASSEIEIASSTAEIGSSQDCKVIFTMLPGCKAVDGVMQELKESVMLSDSSSPRVLVDCSTVSPSTSRRWHETWALSGHIMVDAPVSGGVKGATDAALTFMVGYDHNSAMERVEPLLHSMGKRVMACGGAGTGSASKLCNNLALAAQMIGICEAMNLGEALKVDPVVLADVMNQSTAKCWSCEVNNPHPSVAMVMTNPHGVGPPASRDYEGGFHTSLMLKDLGLALEAAQDAGINMPLTDKAKHLYELASKEGFADKDFGVMLQYLKQK